MSATTSAATTWATVTTAIREAASTAIASTVTAAITTFGSFNAFFRIFAAFTGLSEWVFYA